MRFSDVVLVRVRVDERALWGIVCMKRSVSGVYKYWLVVIQLQY